LRIGVNGFAGRAMKRGLHFLQKFFYTQRNSGVMQLVEVPDDALEFRGNVIAQCVSDNNLMAGNDDLHKTSWFQFSFAARRKSTSRH
jgi:hypothetical protein